jgi:large subunit ribosomal protein L20
MVRAVNGTVSKNRHKKILSLAKGYRGRSSTCYRIAIQKVEKGLQYSYRDRRNKKRDFRGLWIQRINAAAREQGLTYSNFIHGLKLAGIELDRKVLANIAFTEAGAFATLAKQAQDALAKVKKAA